MAPNEKMMKIAFPTAFFDHGITDDRASMRFVLTLNVGNDMPMDMVAHSRIHDIYFPPEHVRFLSGPSCEVVHSWHLLSRGTSDAGLMAGTITKPKIDWRPPPFGEACYAPWPGGDLIKHDEPQGSQTFRRMKMCMPCVRKAMRVCIRHGCGKAVVSQHHGR